MNLNFLFTVFFFLSFISCSSGIQNVLNSLPLDEENIVNSFYELENILKLDLDPLDTSAVSDFVNTTFQSQIQKYLDENSEYFLNKVVNSGIVFHLFLLDIDQKMTSLQHSFQRIRQDCCNLRNNLKEVCEENGLRNLDDLNYFLITTDEWTEDFVRKRLCHLLHEPPARWNQTKRIIGFYIKFLQNIKSFVFPFEGEWFMTSSLSLEIERFEFIIEKFSNFIESGNHLHDLKKLLNELKDLPEPEDNLGKPKFTDPLNIAGMKLLLFSLFSSYVLSLNTFQLVELPELDTKLLCLCIKAEFGLKNTRYNPFETDVITLKKDISIYIENSKKTETYLINAAFEILSQDFLQKFLAGPFPEIRELCGFKEQLPHKTLINLLRNLAEGAFDVDFEETTKMSKLKAQIYLHIVKLKKRKVLNIENLNDSQFKISKYAIKGFYLYFRFTYSKVAR
jgi:hypothetical protein